MSKRKGAKLTSGPIFLGGLRGRISGSISGVSQSRRHGLDPTRTDEEFHHEFDPKSHEKAEQSVSESICKCDVDGWSDVWSNVGLELLVECVVAFQVVANLLPTSMRPEMWTTNLTTISARIVAGCFTLLAPWLGGPPVRLLTMQASHMN